MESDSNILIYEGQDGNIKLDVRLQNETVWLTQKHMAELFQTTKQNISLHVKSIYEEGELLPEATVKKYLTVQTEGQRNVKRELDHYNWIQRLDAIIQLNGRDLLTHAGKISHAMAVEKSTLEYQDYNRSGKSYNARTA